MAKLRFHAFGAGDPLADLADAGSTQAKYLRCYLADMNAKSIIEEPGYFDHDYLAEFAAFYGASTRGYSNQCARLHVFSGAAVDRPVLTKALADESEAAALRDRYLGFVVVRPIPAAPLGRTVLRWYPDPESATPGGAPRVIDPAREYVANLAGLKLSVRGLAWQQQDAAVSACATVALWSMLHASALDDHHAIPSTPEITRRAHSRSSGTRLFPSIGLRAEQIADAISASGLAPIIFEGERGPQGTTGFPRSRFSTVLASLIRSGYPVLLGGQLGSVGRHAVCAVGFREPSAKAPAPGAVEQQDAQIEFCYVHDDNLGPNVRFQLSDAAGRFVRMKPHRPNVPSTGAKLPDPIQSRPYFQPDLMIAAVHEEVRSSVDHAIAQASDIATAILGILDPKEPKGQHGFTLSVRFVKLATYLDRDLKTVLGGNPRALARARLALVERVDPMSLYLSVARIGWGGIPCLDVLFDTTESYPRAEPFCSVIFRQEIADAAHEAQSASLVSLGTLVRAV